MGRFKVGTINERTFAWGKVIFNDIYHITTESWSRFRQELMRRDLESIYEVYRYANRFEVTSFVKGVSLAHRSDEKVKSKEDNG